MRLLAHSPLLSVSSLLCVAALSSQAALASEVRVKTRAQPAGIDDEVMVFTYPSLATKHSLALAEFGTAANQEAYALGLTQTSFGALGVAISRDQSVFTYVNPNTYSTNDNDLVAHHFQRYSFARKFSAGSADIQPRRPIDLFYALPMEGDKGFGVRLTLAGDTDNVQTTAGKVEGSASQADLALGFHMPVSTGRMDLSVNAGLIGKLEESNTPTGGQKTSGKYDRGLSLKLNGRWVETAATGAKPYAKVGLQFEQPKIEASAGGQSQSKKAKDLAFDMQAGALYAPSDRVELNAGLGVFYMQSEGPFALAAPAANNNNNNNGAGTPANSTANAARVGMQDGAGTPAAADATANAIRNGTENVTATFAGPRATRKGYGLILNGGAEALVTDNVGALAGLTYLVWGRLETKDKAAQGEPKYTTNLGETSDADLFALGLFYKREAFRVDASAAIKNFIHNGPNFITGGVTAPIIAQFAASYRF
jgi:hypothetical protein